MRAQGLQLTDCIRYIKTILKDVNYTDPETLPVSVFYES